MWARFYKQDLRVIAHYLGSLLVLFSVAMLVPLLVSLLFGEWAVSVRYVFGVGMTLTAGSALRLAKISPAQMERKQAIAITALAWMVCAFFAAVPLSLSGHFQSPFDAYFESVSALTATGISMLGDIDHLSVADNMWRFTMQFLGGQGVVVVALSLGIFTRTGNSLYNTEGREESVLPSIKKTTQFIWRVSSGVVIIGTIVLFIIFMFSGIEPLRSFFHGLWITIGAYNTGGFASQSLSLIYYHSWPLEVIVMVLMCLGAINFALMARIHHGNWREMLSDIEIRTLATWITVMVLLLVAALMAGDFLTDFSGLMRRGIFTIVSASTNTGYDLLSPNQTTSMLTSGAFFLIAISMAVGGSAGSTAGGIKALRVGIIFKGIVARVKSVLLPPSAQITTTYNHIGKHTLTGDILSSALIIAALYVTTYLLGSLVGIAFGYGALPATFESISVTSNAGLSSGIAVPGAPLLLKIIYILQMWMGRLEFLTLLALFASLIASITPRARVKAFVRRRRG
ncbi:MAG: hypothetical protein LBG97_00030 [Coriobacteriales bacterium]|jgi:trk system potassium uptake protein TrkH|nr:hypothetical protein [Coriobacteriales bacterium]